MNASRQVGKQASRQAGRQTTKQTNKQVSWCMSLISILSITHIVRKISTNLGNVEYTYKYRTSDKRAPGEPSSREISSPSWARLVFFQPAFPMIVTIGFSEFQNWYRCLSSVLFLTNRRASYRVMRFSHIYRVSWEKFRSLIPATFVNVQMKNFRSASRTLWIILRQFFRWAGNRF